VFEIIIQKWWVFLLRGLAAILFGVLAMVWPQLTLLTLVILFGAFLLVEGIFSVIAGVTSRKQNYYWWTLLFTGLLEIAIGLLTLLWPNVTGIILLYLIGSWAVIIGIMDIILAIQIRREIKNEWLLIIDGVFSVVIGLLLFIFPSASAVALAWLIGLFAIFLGIVFIILAFRLRKLAGEINKFR
jgi:uncharacterized membrane protein HdeD (DUF308 family)